MENTTQVHQKSTGKCKDNRTGKEDNTTEVFGRYHDIERKKQGDNSSQCGVKPYNQMTRWSPGNAKFFSVLYVKYL